MCRNHCGKQTPIGCSASAARVSSSSECGVIRLLHVAVLRRRACSGELSRLFYADEAIVKNFFSCQLSFSAWVQAREKWSTHKRNGPKSAASREMVQIRASKKIRVDTGICTRLVFTAIPLDMCKPLVRIPIWNRSILSLLYAARPHYTSPNLAWKHQTQRSLHELL